MMVLVACERSGRVRDAFLAQGHDAVSCDIEPTEVPGPHIVDDALRVLRAEEWDMVIAFPPCTYLSNVAACCISGEKCNHVGRGPSRRLHCIDAALFFRAFLDCESVPRRAVENPVPHTMARHLMGEPTCTVQPYHHGDPWTKRTYLWLRGLSPLVPSNRVQPTHRLFEGKWAKRGQRSLPSMDAEGFERSRLSSGIAAAMADQWSDPELGTLF